MVVPEVPESLLHHLHRVFLASETRTSLVQTPSNLCLSLREEVGLRDPRHGLGRFKKSLDRTSSNTDSLFLLKVCENKVDFEITKFIIFGITRSLSSTTLLSFTKFFHIRGTTIGCDPSDLVPRS